MANSMSPALRTTLINTLSTIADPTLRTKAAIRLIRLGRRRGWEATVSDRALIC